MALQSVRAGTLRDDLLAFGVIAAVCVGLLALLPAKAPGPQVSAHAPV